MAFCSRLSDSFDDLRHHLEEADYESYSPANPRINSERVIEETFDLIDASEMFLFAAVYHDSPHSYELGEVAFDDLAQKISILTLQYHEEYGELHDLYEEVREEKKKIDNQFNDIEGIVERSYREISISLEQHRSNN